MKKGIAKFTAFCLAAGLTFGEGGMVLLAAGTETTLAGLSGTLKAGEHTQKSNADASGDLDDASEEAAAEQTEDIYEETDAAPDTDADENIPVVTDTAGLEQLIAEARELTGKEQTKADVPEADEDAPAVTISEAAPADDTASDEEKAAGEGTAAPEEEAAQEEEAGPAENTNEEEAAADASADEDGDGQEAAQEQTEEQTEELDRSMVGTTGFAQCSEYLNVRASGDQEGEVVGKIYHNGSLEILDVDADGWYHIRSGNVEGYVAGQYVATGEEASEIAENSGYTTAEVGAEVLNMRLDPSTDSEVVGSVTESEKIEVVEDQGDWVKIVTEDGVYGYVSADYVYTSTEYATGETLEEEQARLDEEWLDYLAEQEALAASVYYDSYEDYGGYYEPSYDYSYDTSYYYSEEQAAADAWAAEAQAQADWAAQVAAEAQAAADAAAQAAYSYDNSDAQAQADYLYQEYLNAQAAADEAVANGYDEQTIINTAQAAQTAYGYYVEAQNAADYSYQAEVDAAAQAEAQAAADAAAQAAAEAQAAADAAAAQAQAEADAAAQAAAEAQYQAEAAYQEAQYQESASSAGSSVANYACQFVGNPYVWGGSSLTGGADCSGFTMAVYAQFGVSLPHNAAAQSGCGTAVSLDSLQPGDLIFYGDGISHVAMYIGGGSVVHASNSTNGIIISNYNYRSPVCARRYL